MIFEALVIAGPSLLNRNCGFLHTLKKRLNSNQERQFFAVMLNRTSPSYKPIESFATAAVSDMDFSVTDSDDDFDFWDLDDTNEEVRRTAYLDFLLGNEFVFNIESNWNGKNVMSQAAIRSYDISRFGKDAEFKSTNRRKMELLIRLFFRAKRMAATEVISLEDFQTLPTFYDCYITRRAGFVLIEKPFVQLSNRKDEVWMIAKDSFTFRLEMYRQMLTQLKIIHRLGYGLNSVSIESFGFSFKDKIRIIFTAFDKLKKLGTTIRLDGRTIPDLETFTTRESSVTNDLYQFGLLVAQMELAEYEFYQPSYELLAKESSPIDKQREFRERKGKFAISIIRLKRLTIPIEKISFETFVSKLIAVETKDRYQSADAALSDLTMLFAAQQSVSPFPAEVEAYKGKMLKLNGKRSISA